MIIMNCPFCGNKLSYFDTIQNKMGVKVEFTCDDADCEKGEGKVFFAYVHEGDLEY